MVGIRVALVVGLTAIGAACGSDDRDRVERFCTHFEEHQAAPDGARDEAEVLAEEAVLVRIAPYEIADEMAVVAAANRAEADGSGPVVRPERLDAAEAEVDRWVAGTCG